MRQRFFRALLQRYESGLPEWTHRLLLQILMDTTAKGFGVRPVRVLGSSAQDGLTAYALFTKECMEKHRVPAKRLYRVSYRLGARLRRITGFTAVSDCRSLVFFLYRHIGITMTGCLPGEICMSRCFFSSVYSPTQCRYISAMDHGIIAGICGGGTLNFQRRITEGCGCCSACFTEDKNID